MGFWLKSILDCVLPFSVSGNFATEEQLMTLVHETSIRGVAAGRLGCDALQHQALK
ncbi:hypothetical protein NZK35_27670 [Stieleria sp. ICT_E10.1]|uniref:hypothetical protein n=1 Tax=Stieleria sedimenti TaxID=2976331 RepID=UPI00217FD7AE|nr:hypothetical protein [Stieleria sedimenti]MCS7470447.1 hypothetical protein [Stieleria sedimenti]